MARVNLLWLNWRRVAVDTRGIGSYAKLVALYLQTFMNDDQHMAWPSLDRMCLELEMSRPTAVKALKTLEKAGLLQKHRRFGKTTMYYARFPRQVEQALLDLSSSRDELVDGPSSSPHELSVVHHVDPNSPSNSPSKEHICPSAPEDGFSGFWSAYPRKVGRKPALALWVKLAQAERAAVLADLGQRQWPADVTYVPHPRTYLSQRRWEDEVGGAAAPVFGEDL